MCADATPRPWQCLPLPQGVLVTAAAGEPAILYASLVGTRTKTVAEARANAAFAVRAVALYDFIHEKAQAGDNFAAALLSEFAAGHPD